MSTQTTHVTLKGNPVELSGSIPEVGQAAPDCVLTAQDLSSVSLKSFWAEKTCVIFSVPSLDTPVCDTETKKFQDEAAQRSDVHFVAVSTDLPFAQKRWCGAAGVDKVSILSDHKETAFGKAYGILIPSLRILARAVFVVSPEGKILYREVVPEVAEEPDYDALRKALGNG